MASWPYLFDALQFAEARYPQLNVKSWADSPATAYTIQIRGLTRHGQINLGHTTNTSRVGKSETFNLPGYPIFVMISTASVNRPGRLYLKVVLRAGGVTIAHLISGYLTAGRPLKWPEGPSELMTSGPGYIHLLTGTDPAANVEISETVPTNTVYLLETLYFSLVTDANAADRTVAVTFDDGTSEFMRVEPNIVQVASKTYYYTFGIGFPEDIALKKDAIHAPLPDMPLPEAYRIKTVTDNRQATDNFGAPLLRIREWQQE